MYMLKIILKKNASMPLLHMFYIYRHFFKKVTSNPSNDAIALVNNLYFRSFRRSVNLLKDWFAFKRQTFNDRPSTLHVGFFLIKN